MFIDCQRAITLIEKTKPLLVNGWIMRSTLYLTFIDCIGGSESKFNSLIFLLKSGMVFSEYNRWNGYHVDLIKFDAFKKKYEARK